MASKQSTVDFILGQISSTHRVSAKKMFGEYTLYYDEKIIALVCDDKLFLKPTPQGKDFLGDCSEASPYPGAKPCFVIPNDKCEDTQWLSHLIQITANQIPVPKKKTAKKAS
jgi:DNA transformation protein and related proteins